MFDINKILRREKPVTDSRFERQIITGMIINDEFLKAIASIYHPGCLQIPFAQTISAWIFEYFKKYEISPKQHIEDIYKEKKNSIYDPDEALMIENFLLDISDEYTKGEVFNVGYILDKAENHFRQLSLSNLSTNIKKSLIGGRLEEAEAIIKGYKRVEVVKTRGVDPITDSKVIFNAMNEKSNSKLFKLPGVLGNLIGQLERGWLFSIVGSSGTGKTWWLMLIALRAVFAGLNVVFVSMEMSEEQMVRRIQHWINGKPTRKWEGEMLIPVFDCKKNQTGECNLSKRCNDITLGAIKPDFNDADENYKVCTVCKGTSFDFELETWFNLVNKQKLTIADAVRKSQAIKRSSLLRGNSFKLIAFPSRSKTMEDIRAYLHNLEYYNGFVPDVIVTDYADKVKPHDTRQQWRHQISEIWEGHKSLAQEKNCLVVTASQSNTARTGKTIKQGDWSEAISKLELSDVGMAINMKPEDKKIGRMMATIMKQRHDEFDLLQQVMVLHQLKIGRPYLDSCVVR